MHTRKMLASLLCLLSGPLLAQMAPMGNMGPMGTMTSLPQSSPAPMTDLLAGVPSRAPRKLEFFLDLADRSNPTLLQAAAMIHRAEAQARQAALYPNPTIGYEGDQIRGGSYGGGEQGGFVAQTVVLGGKLGLRRDVYQQQQQVETVGAEAQRMRVHNDVTQMFYNALSAQQTVVVRGRLLALANDAVQTAHQLSNVGQADAPDVLQAEVEAEQASIDATVAQRKFIQNFKQLVATAGDLSIEIAPLDAVLDALPEIDAPRVAQTMVDQSPLVRQAQQEVLVAEASLKAARREVVPDLALRAGEQANLEQLGDSPGRKTGAQSFASASIELPLWNRNQGNIRASEVAVAQAKQEVIRTRLTVAQKGEVLAQEYASARLEAERYQTALLPRARRAYELYLAKYQSMAQAYPQVIVSQRTLFELEVHYIDALDRVWQNATALQYFALQGGLEKPAATP